MRPKSPSVLSIVLDGERRRENIRFPQSRHSANVKPVLIEPQRYTLQSTSYPKYHLRFTLSISLDAASREMISLTQAEETKFLEQRFEGYAVNARIIHAKIHKMQA